MTLRPAGSSPSSTTAIWRQRRASGARLRSAAPGPVVEVADFTVGNDPGDSNFDDIIVNALHVDNINEKIYVTYQDPFGDASNTGIRQFGYDPLTGAVIDEGFLVRADLESNKEIDPDNFGLDLLNVRDFELDLSSNTLYFTELFTGGLQEQGLYRMDLTTKVITQMVSSTQFPDEGTNGYHHRRRGRCHHRPRLFHDGVAGAVRRRRLQCRAQRDLVGRAERRPTRSPTQVMLIGLPRRRAPLSRRHGVRPGHAPALCRVRRGRFGGSTDDVIYVFQLDAAGTTASLVDTIEPDA